MSENLLQTLQQLVQDVIAPDVRELKVRMGAVEKQLDFMEKHMENRFAAMDQKMDGLEKRMESRFAAMDQKFDSLEKRMEARFTAMDQKNDLQFRAILAAMSERVAVLESQRH